MTAQHGWYVPEQFNVQNEYHPGTLPNNDIVHIDLKELSMNCSAMVLKKSCSIYAWICFEHPLQYGLNTKVPLLRKTGFIEND